MRVMSKRKGGERTIRCPYCGYEGPASDFTFMYESVLYMADHEIIGEKRERPPLVICPRCGRGFFLESPYTKLVEKMKGEK
jgi:uncharacterized C2H2 Zn-finger protein